MKNTENTRFLTLLGVKRLGEKNQKYREFFFLQHTQKNPRIDQKKPHTQIIFKKTQQKNYPKKPKKTQDLQKKLQKKKGLHK